MKILRTPDVRFEDLPDYPFQPRYLDLDGLRIHYVDEGVAEVGTVLLLHGEPSWSYLYRHMVTAIAASGLRAIAPDLVGFGKSDKPSSRKAYSYAGHVAWMKAFIERLQLRDITLFCQDWGSLIGLRLAAENDQRFARIVLANGGLPTGDEELPGAFRRWQQFTRWSPWFPVGRIIQAGTVRALDADELRAYDAPFPSMRYKAGARAFPLLVPTSVDDPAAAANRQAWRRLREWDKPFLTAFSDRDPITRGAALAFQSTVPGAQGLEHPVIRGAGHFLQEDASAELARCVVELVAATG